jgi:hypothetical protein
MNIVVSQVTSSVSTANNLINFSDKMKYKNVWLHLFSINPQITVAVVYLLTCTWPFRYDRKRLPCMVNDMFQLRNLREIWSFHSGMRRWGFASSWMQHFVARFVIPDVSKAVRSVESSGTTNPVIHSRIQEVPKPHLHWQLPKQKYYLCSTGTVIQVTALYIIGTLSEHITIMFLL